MRKAFIHFLWGALILFICGTAFAFVAIWEGWIGYMPPVEDLQNPISRYATQVYFADGKVMGTYNFNKENRIVIPYSKISKHLVEACNDRSAQDEPGACRAARLHTRPTPPPGLER